MITFLQDLFAAIETRLDLKYPPTAVGGIRQSFLAIAW
jgi:hypothetical protein